ncbi:hypothetical protein MHYP_G00180740 [Metynnis hypsauchen]
MLRNRDSIRSTTMRQQPYRTYWTFRPVEAACRSARGSAERARTVQLVLRSCRGESGRSRSTQACGGAVARLVRLNSDSRAPTEELYFTFVAQEPPQCAHGRRSGAGQRGSGLLRSRDKQDEDRNTASFLSHVLVSVAQLRPPLSNSHCSAAAPPPRPDTRHRLHHTPPDTPMVWANGSAPWFPRSGRPPNTDMASSSTSSSIRRIRQTAVSSQPSQ